ncbi:alginate O-acetyltransferase AlgX-related protein [Amycolatopsis xylanica]|nr:hypothetical protein [Amycolatopsis xylanica]
MASEPQQLPAVHEAWLPREHALHRPRHGGRQMTALVCALMFFVTPTLLWIVGVRPTEIENHKLASFPSLGDGWKFFTGLPGWATDQLSFRSGAISAADGISRGLFGEGAPLDQAPPPVAGPIPGATPSTPKNAPSPQGSPNSQAGYRRVVQGVDGWLYYGYDAEAKCAPSRPLADTLSRINTLRQAVESSGRKFVFVIAPDKTTMVPQKLPASYPDKDCSQPKQEADWAQFLAAGALDLRPELKKSEGRVGRPIYPPNDTHWTDEGALVMARDVANAVQPGVTQTWVSTPTRMYDVNADLPPLLGRNEVKTLQEYTLKPDGAVDRGGLSNGDIDKPVYRKTSPLVGTIDKRTLIYGDSFTKASSRYLPGGFTNLTMLAHYTSKTTQEQAIDEFVNAEVVVVEAVERSVSAGQLTFIEDGFLNAVRAKLEEHPIG